MEYLSLILIGIFVMFFVLIFIKNTIKNKKLCALCLSITIAWLTLLGLYLGGLFSNNLIIGILMGHTSLGLFYLWEKRVRGKTKIFRLPLLLTFISLIYFILERISMEILFVLGIFWIFFGIIYLLKNNRKINKFAGDIISCCRDW